MNERFSDLSRPRQFLIRLCQFVNFGSVLNVTVNGGEIVLDGLLDVVVDVKLDADVVTRSELTLRDFELTAEARRLFRQIDLLKSGQIEVIAVHQGVPRHAFIRRSISPEVIL